MRRTRRCRPTRRSSTRSRTSRTSPGRTERVRLGTHVYNLGLRHPFVAARAVQTLDIVSGGRFEFGIGASWLEEEWVAVELDFTTRGRRVDEAIEVCKQLWTEDAVDHHGEFFDFEGAVFVPKCVQQPWPPILVGGESDAGAAAGGAPRRRLDRDGPHVRVAPSARSGVCASCSTRHGPRRGGLPDLPRRPGRVAGRRRALGGARRHPPASSRRGAARRRRSTALRRFADLHLCRPPEPPRSSGVATESPDSRGSAWALAEQVVGVVVPVADGALHAERDRHLLRLHRVADAALLVAQLARRGRSRRGPCRGPSRCRRRGAARSTASDSSGANVASAHFMNPPRHGASVNGAGSTHLRPSRVQVCTSSWSRQTFTSCRVPELGAERDLDVVLTALGAAGDAARRVRDARPARSNWCVQFRRGSAPTAPTAVQRSDSGMPAERAQRRARVRSTCPRPPDRLGLDRDDVARRRGGA